MLRIAHLLLIALCLVLFATNLTLAQKINPKRPAVYIIFRDFVAKTPDPAYPSQGARLVLHNNTRWAIFYTGHYDPTVAGEQIIYIIELADGQRDERKYVDVVRSGIKIMSGKTLTFMVPRADFPKGSKIYVEFSFSWDHVSAENNIGDATVHRAYFRANDLPKWPAD
jgi:hypothetical protein